MRCRTIQAFGMAAAMLVGGLMWNATAHAQAGTMEKAKAKVADSTSAQPPSEVYGGLRSDAGRQV
jgi:hypothetical protein